MEGRGQVDRDDRVPFVDGEFVDRADMLDACIVHEDVAGARLCDQRAALIALGHVGLDIPGGHAVIRRDLARQSVILVAVGEGVQDDIRPCLGQFARNAQSDPGIGPGDDGGFSLQRHAPLLLVMLVVNRLCRRSIA